MNKQTFLNDLYLRIQGLPDMEVQKSIAYYSEMIDDRIEDGMSEEEAVLALGAPEEIAEQILLASSLPTLMRTKMKKKHTYKVWEIVLLILGSPIWISLLLAFFAIILSVYIAIWSIIVAFYAVVFAFAASSLIGVSSCFMLFVRGQIPAAVLMIGMSLFLAGLAILTFLGVNKLSVWLIRLSSLFMRWVKSLFIKKEVTE